MGQQSKSQLLLNFSSMRALPFLAPAMTLANTLPCSPLLGRSICSPLRRSMIMSAGLKCNQVNTLWQSPTTDYEKAFSMCTTNGTQDMPGFLSGWSSLMNPLHWLNISWPILLRINPMVIGIHGCMSHYVTYRGLYADSTLYRVPNTDYAPTINMDTLPYHVSWCVTSSKAKKPGHNSCHVGGIQFGIKLHNSVWEALHLDAELKNNIWAKAIQKEMDGLSAHKCFIYQSSGVGNHHMIINSHHSKWSSQLSLIYRGKHD